MWMEDSVAGIEFRKLIVPSSYRNSVRSLTDTCIV